MDYCWHCPICDNTFTMDVTPERLQELKAEAASGESIFTHPWQGQDHPIYLVERKH